MPLISDSSEPLGGRLLIWQLDNETAYPETLFGQAEDLLKGIVHPLRRSQRLATCALLGLLGPGAVNSLYYDLHGKPWIRDPEGHISISHSDKLAGLYYHPERHAGIDIESPHPRIARVANRFLHAEKEKWAQSDYQLLQVWSAKEAVFKAIGGGGIHFSEDLHVEHPSDSGMGLIHYQGHMGNKTYKARYLNLEAALLVYTIAEEDAG